MSTIKYVVTREGLEEIATNGARKIVQEAVRLKYINKEDAADLLDNHTIVTVLRTSLLKTMAEKIFGKETADPLVEIIRYESLRLIARQDKVPDEPKGSQPTTNKQS